ncbi:MAG: apolipoprotein N-acyltransferase [Spirochaetes bacterium]|nr:apolipoprotein N-acyltransferase [Spirochaetota bacterium]
MNLSENSKINDFFNNLKIKFFYLLLLLSIILIILSFYFIGYNYFIFISYVPLFFVLYKIEKENKDAKKIIFLFYFTLYLFLTLFINKITSYVKVMYLAYLGLALTLTIFSFVIFYFVYFFFNLLKRIQKIKKINYPLIFILSQLFYELIMFSGQLSFPWFNVSLPVAIYPKFISIASIFGYIFVSIWVLFINYILYLIIVRVYGIVINLKIIEKEIKNDGKENVYYNINLNFSNTLIKSGKSLIFKELKKPVIVLIFLILFPILWYYVDPFKKMEKTNLKITIAQHNYPLNFKFRYEYFPKMLKKIIDANDILKNETDLIVWSESSYPDFFMDSEDNKNLITKSVIKNNINIIIGFPYYDGKYYYNCASLINKEGKIFIYNKIHLVPFGEFIPFSDILKFLEKLAPEVGISQHKGELIDPFVISTTKNSNITDKRESYRFYPTICFEGIYSYLFYQMKKKGAQFFINITNDSYYMNTYQPKQHLYLQVFRTVEFNVMLFRSSSTGISAIINNRGEILNNINENVTGFTTNLLYIPKSKTIYESFGINLIFFIRYIVFVYLFSIFFLIIYFKILKRIKS